MDWPWAQLCISGALLSGWTLAPQCSCTPIQRPSLSPLGTLGSHLHCWGRGDLFPGSLQLEREITRVLTKPEALWVFRYELYLPSLTQDVRSSFELLDQQVSGSFGDLQDLQVTCVEQTIIWLNHVSINHRSIYSGQGFLRDLVSSCCEWSFLWQSCSWCYLLHKHHTDPPVCLKQSARHNLHAALGGRKAADMRGNEEMWVRRWYCDLLLVTLDSGVTSKMFGWSKQSLSPWWVCGLG